MHAVVAGGHGDVEDLLDRVAAGLAGLRDDDVGELRLVSEEEIVEREQEASAGGGAECGPGRLGAASRGERGVEVGVGGLRDAGERCAIQGDTVARVSAAEARTPVSRRSIVADGSSWRAAT